MSQYWKVRRNNFDSFIRYISSKYYFGHDIKVFKDYYDGEDDEDDEDYLYLFLRYNSSSWTAWLSYCRPNELVVNKECKYNGEYYGRKNKLKELYKLSTLEVE